MDPYLLTGPVSHGLADQLWPVVTAQHRRDAALSDQGLQVGGQRIAGDGTLD